MARYTPRTIDFADTAPVRFEASEVVTSSPAEVWDVLCDHARWPEWMGSLKRVTPMSEPASGVGSTREVVLSGGLAFQEEFIAWDEPERWAFTGVEGPPVAVGLVERVTLEPVDGGTRVTETFDWSTSRFPKGIEWAGYPSKHPAAMERTLARLDTYVTTGEVPGD